MRLDRVGVFPAVALVLGFGRPTALEGLALLPPPDELVAVGLVDARQLPAFPIAARRGWQTLVRPKWNTRHSAISLLQCRVLRSHRSAHGIRRLRRSPKELERYRWLCLLKTEIST